MAANTARLHQFSAMSNNITDKWTSSTFMFSESQLAVLEVGGSQSRFYFADELRPPPKPTRLLCGACEPEGPLHEQ